ncbi:MAG: PP2C family serine/threonine-protein phosphatase [Roseiarcus sp.]
MSRVKWKVAGASVAGFSHQTDGTPCQDAHAITTSPSGWLIAAVSDGAGSAPRSAEGSRLFSDEVVAQLTTRLREIDLSELHCPDENTVRTWIEDAVESVRTRLAEIATASNGSLGEFHATLLGVVAGPKAGVFFHVGDGAACATNLDDSSRSVVSKPENGEYANETYFVTQDDWRDHLRLTSFNSQYNLIALMSDGVTPFALATGSVAPFPPFFEPLSKFLAEHSRRHAEQAITTLLERDAIRPITGDDKTLVWAIRTGSEA